MPDSFSHPKLSGEFFGNRHVTLSVCAPASRLVLRATESGIQLLDKKVGTKLPRKPKESVTKGGRLIMWLGPDEWLLVDESSNPLTVSSLGLSKSASAIDVSHRQCAIMIEGAGAEALLSCGCPQDLRLTSFGVGACSRTVFGKSEIILVRTGPDAFRLECWRSFMDYVWNFLVLASRDIDD